MDQLAVTSKRVAEEEDCGRCYQEEGDCAPAERERSADDCTGRHAEKPERFDRGIADAPVQDRIEVRRSDAMSTGRVARLHVSDANDVATRPRPENRTPEGGAASSMISSDPNPLPQRSFRKASRRPRLAMGEASGRGAEARLPVLKITPEPHRSTPGSFPGCLARTWC
jgi:hypothetical protein